MIIGTGKGWDIAAHETVSCRALTGGPGLRDVSTQPDREGMVSPGQISWPSPGSLRDRLRAGFTTASRQRPKGLDTTPRIGRLTSEGPTRHGGPRARGRPSVPHEGLGVAVVHDRSPQAPRAIPPVGEEAMQMQPMAAGRAGTGRSPTSQEDPSRENSADTLATVIALTGMLMQSVGWGLVGSLGAGRSSSCYFATRSSSSPTGCWSAGARRPRRSRPEARPPTTRCLSTQ